MRNQRPRRLRRLVLGRKAKYSPDGETMSFTASYWFIGLPVLVMIMVLSLLTKDQLRRDSPFIMTVQMAAMAIFGMIGLILLGRATVEFDQRRGAWCKRSSLLWLPLAREKGMLSEIQRLILERRESLSGGDAGPSVGYYVSMQVGDREVEIAPFPGFEPDAKEEARLMASFLARPLEFRERLGNEAPVSRGEESLEQLEAALGFSMARSPETTDERASEMNER